jgi:hypothetical protein
LNFVEVAAAVRNEQLQKKSKAWNRTVALGDVTKII